MPQNTVRKNRKRLAGNLNSLRKKNENIFSMPAAAAGPKKPKWKTISATGLKPNTKYKVMLDNHPGSSFEDITDYAKPIGESVKNNTHRSGKGAKARMMYLKSDADGRLDYKVRPYGTDEVETTGNSEDSSTNWSNLWEYWYTRGSDNDKARNKIKLIAYSAVNNPESDSKVKTIKYDLTPTIPEIGIAGPMPAPDVIPPGLYCDCTPPRPGQVDKYLEEERRSSYYQTFFIDADKVDRSETVDLLDVTLYIRSKPLRRGLNTSGRQLPGISIRIMDCESDGTPISGTRYADSFVRKSWSEIKSSPLATSGTVFNFKGPLRLRTNRFYAIAVSVEDGNYAFWLNKKGDLVLLDGVKTENRSQGSSKGHRGDIFYYDRLAAPTTGTRRKSADGLWRANNDLDLKFDVNIAEYTLSTIDILLNNGDYEFFDMHGANTGSTWAPGELVYKQRPYSNGAVTILKGTNKITGDANTKFDEINDGQKIVIVDSANSEIQEVFTVDKSIAGSNSIMYVDEYSERDMSGNLMVTVVGELEYYDYYFKNIRLAESSVNYTEYSSNTDMRFEVDDFIVGVETGTQGQISGYKELPISVFRSNWNCTLPPTFKPVTSYNMSESTGSGTYALSTENKVFSLNAPNHLDTYEGVLISHSQEVDQTTLTNANTSNEFKSGQINLQYQYQGANTRSYTAPTLDLEEIEIVTHRWFINNDGANEHLNEGNALTRHISRTLELGEGNNAEDIRVIMNAWRPAGTNIEVYAKIQNLSDQQPFDDKHWTKLEVITGADEFSSPLNRFDFRELEFSFANFTSSVQVDATFTTENGNNIITVEDGGVDANSAVSTTDVIKISSPLFPENYQLFAVEAVDADTITLSEPVSNVNIVGEGFLVDVMNSAESGFRNPDNYNSVSYFTEEGVKYDTYNRVAIKIVMLADSRRLVPKVDDYRVIGVTA